MSEMSWPASRSQPMLISFSGLPATGKSTIARIVAAHRCAAYVRVDTIEVAIGRSEGIHEPTNAWDLAPGYQVGEAVAADQLRVGLDVVVDAVNASEAARDGWRDIAEEQRALLLEVEIVCSDPAEHRRRAEQREIDVPGLTAPTWQRILDRAYAPWSRDRLVLDTALTDAEAAARAVCVAARSQGDRSVRADD